MRSAPTAMNSILETGKGNFSLSLPRFLTFRIKYTLNNKDARCNLMGTRTSVQPCLPQNRARKIFRTRASPFPPPPSFSYLSPPLPFSLSLFLLSHNFQTLITWLVHNLVCLNFSSNSIGFQSPVLSTNSSWFLSIFVENLKRI